MKLSIATKRVYERASPSDGQRVLVDGLWPRGLKKEEARMARWAKDVAPSAKLRRWFHHAPERWLEFQARYFEELDARPDVWLPILAAARAGKVTLLFAAADTRRNNAVALKSYLQLKAPRWAMGNLDHGTGVIEHELRH